MPTVLEIHERADDQYRLLHKSVRGEAVSSVAARLVEIVGEQDGYRCRNYNG